MMLKLLPLSGLLGVALCAMPASALTAQQHRHHQRAVAESAGEIAQTQRLNEQQLAVAQTATMQTAAAEEPMPGPEPVAKPMMQRVPGGDPLHSGARGGGVAHPASTSGPVVSHN